MKTKRNKYNNGTRSFVNPDGSFDMDQFVNGSYAMSPPQIQPSNLPAQNQQDDAAKTMEAISGLTKMTGAMGMMKKGTKKVEQPKDLKTKVKELVSHEKAEAKTFKKLADQHKGLKKGTKLIKKYQEGTDEFDPEVATIYGSRYSTQGSYPETKIKASQTPLRSFQQAVNNTTKNLQTTSKNIQENKANLKANIDEINKQKSSQVAKNTSTTQPLKKPQVSFKGNTSEESKENLKSVEKFEKSTELEKNKMQTRQGVSQDITQGSDKDFGTYNSKLYKAKSSDAVPTKETAKSEADAKRKASIDRLNTSRNELRENRGESERNQKEIKSLESQAAKGKAGGWDAAKQKRLSELRSRNNELTGGNSSDYRADKDKTGGTIGRQERTVKNQSLSFDKTEKDNEEYLAANEKQNAEIDSRNKQRAEEKAKYRESKERAEKVGTSLKNIVKGGADRSLLGKAQEIANNMSSSKEREDIKKEKGGNSSGEKQEKAKPISKARKFLNSIFNRG